MVQLKNFDKSASQKFSALKKEASRSYLDLVKNSSNNKNNDFVRLFSYNYFLKSLFYRKYKMSNAIQLKVK